MEFPYKAANPGCSLEDFVRWHSPPDWLETDSSDETKDCSDEEEPISRKGYLSTRMQKEGLGQQKMQALSALKVGAWELKSMILKATVSDLQEAVHSQKFFLLLCANKKKKIKGNADKYLV